MLSRRQFEVIAAVLILVLLLILLVWMLTKNDREVDEIVVPAGAVEIKPVIDERDIPTPGAVSASTVARVFVERFGSFSSETDFANVSDIMQLATSSYQSELAALVASYRRQTVELAGYTGISTLVISLKPVSESDTATTLLVTTQREEAVGDPGNTTLRYQVAEVSLVKVGDNWLVNELAWQ